MCLVLKLGTLTANLYRRFNEKVSTMIYFTIYHC